MKHFSPFRLDTVNQCLWRGETRVPLRPKPFALLTYLVQNAERLVTQREILQAVWRGIFVQPEVLKSHIREVRTALGDDPKHPSFIETLPRRGYRFMKAVEEMAGQRAMADASRVQIVGREGELQKLRHYLRQAAVGQRQVVFITGEAGIGKTTLVDAFSHDAREHFPGIRIALSQCVEAHGVQEPYYPFLVVMGELLREHEDLLPLLETHAPTWLAQFPGLLKPEHGQTLRREILGATHQRMVRELCDLLPLITAEHTFLVILEDIHWADTGTMELIAAIAHRRNPARLLLLATYRPVEAVVSQHVLKQVKQDLAVHGLCHELEIASLSQGEVGQYVAQYLAAQSPGQSVPLGLAELLHRLSEGNPLFLRAALDHLLARGHLSCSEAGWSIHVPLEGIEMEVPESLRQMLELQVDRLSADEQRALAAASVCGVLFPAQVGAAVAEFDVERYEDICRNLSQQRQILRANGLKAFPNGAATPCYQFVHAFYRQTIYDRLPLQRRSRLHLRAGQSLEALYAGSPIKIASEFALHFEAGCDWKKAAKYLQLSADTKGQRFAYHKAALDLEHALELLARLPDGESAADEMEIRQKLGAIYFALEDFPRSVATLEAVAKRAALNQDSLTEINVLGQMGIVLGRISSRQAASVVSRLFELCDQEKHPVLQSRARMAALVHRLALEGPKQQDVQQFRGELAQVSNLIDRPVLAAHTTELALLQVFFSEYQDSIRNIKESLPALIEAGDIRHRAALIILLMDLIFSGNWGEALHVVQEAIAKAQKNGNHSRENVLRVYQAWIHLVARDWSRGLELCEAALPMLRDPYQTAYLRHGLILAGTSLVELGRYEPASKYLLQAREQMDSQPVAMDWYWRMPLQSALTELSLRRGDLGQAGVEARRFVETSVATAERTWQALAWAANARVALAGSDLEHGQECIHKAIAAMQGFDLPLALWRVHATAMKLLPQAAGHHRLAATGILRLAESLKEFPALQKTFLSSIGSS